MQYVAQTFSTADEIVDITFEFTYEDGPMGKLTAALAQFGEPSAPSPPDGSPGSPPAPATAISLGLHGPTEVPPDFVVDGVTISGSMELQHLRSGEGGGVWLDLYYTVAGTRGTHHFEGIAVMFAWFWPAPQAPRATVRR